MTITRSLLLAVVVGACALRVGPAPFMLPLLAGGDVTGWEERSFTGRTRYAAAHADGVKALRADAMAAASGLYLERPVDLQHWPVLRWRWRVAGSLMPGDERTRSGDDFAARVYVIARSPLPFWKTRAICYVWAGREAVGQTWPNPYATDVMMVVLRSGDGDAGRWTEERRDVAEDFARLFGETPSRIDAIAIMTDTDQSGGAATAWYDGLRFEKGGARRAP